MNIIGQMLNRHTIETENELINAIKEVFQEIALLGLYRGGFFEKACFYGGTALRIFYGLDRFSEDLDFSILQKNDSFDIEKYFPNIINEFEALGIDMTVSKKIKQNKTGVETAFLKTAAKTAISGIDNKQIAELSKYIHQGQIIKIKVEVDVNPPLKFRTESKTLLLPTTFNIVSMTLPNLYAGKMHAVLFRSWANRAKGRDWYDFEWYVKNGAKLNLKHLKERMIKSGDWKEEDLLNKEAFKDLMIKKIDCLDIKSAINEVKPFIKNLDVLEPWSKKYFKLLIENIKFD